MRKNIWQIQHAKCALWNTWSIQGTPPVSAALSLLAYHSAPTTQPIPTPSSMYISLTTRVVSHSTRTQKFKVIQHIQGLLHQEAKREENTEWTDHKAVVCSTGNYIQYPAINPNGKEYEKESRPTCIYWDHSAVQQKLTQHHKSTTL